MREELKKHKKRHVKKHKQLHKALDELMADFISHTERLISETSVLELAQWSHQQTMSPTEQ